MGTYNFLLTLSDGQTIATDSISVFVQNVSPSANAGADKVVHIGRSAKLSATQSADPDGDTMTVSWSITSKPTGSLASISDITTWNISLTPDVMGTYNILLQISDGYSVATDSVMLNIGNNQPQITGITSCIIHLGTSLTLSAAGVSDADADSLTINWVLLNRPVGSSLTIDSIRQDQVILPDKTGTYDIKLIVSDTYCIVSLSFTILARYQNQNNDPKSGVTTSVVIPPGVLNLDADIVISFNAQSAQPTASIPTTDAETGRTMVYSLSLAEFDIVVVPTRSDAGRTDATISGNVEITLVVTRNLNAQRTRVFYFDTTSGRWSNAGIGIVSITGNTLVFRVAHLTLFSLVEVSYDNNAPQVQSIKLNGNNIIAGDFLTVTQPTINLVATDAGVSADGIVSYRLQWINSGLSIIADTSTVNISANIQLTLDIKTPIVLPDGTYIVRVILLDGAAHLSQSDSSQFRIGLSENIELFDAMPAPNPFDPNSEVSHIGCQLNKTGSVKLTIYGLSGKKIYSSSQSNLNAGYNEITWDGKDDWGQIVKNDVYFGVLFAESQGKSSKAIVKIMVIKK